MDNLIAFLWFALAASISPGPNNIMVTASGANFGYRRTLPHLLGVTFGFPVLLMLLGLGFGDIFLAYPQIHTALKWAGSGYLLFLAYKIATASPAKEGADTGRPFTFLQAAAFQWLNPKAWLVALSSITAFTTIGGNLMGEAAVMASFFPPITFVCVSIWCLFGAQIGRWLTSPAALRGFNLAMAALVVASLALVLT